MILLNKICRLGMQLYVLPQGGGLWLVMAGGQDG